MTIQGSAVDQERREAALGLARRDRHAGVLQALHERFAVRDGEQHGEALGAPAILGHRALEVALDALAVEDLDPGDVAPLQLMAELAVGRTRPSGSAGRSSS